MSFLGSTLSKMLSLLSLPIVNGISNWGSCPPTPENDIANIDIVKLGKGNWFEIFRDANDLYY